MPHHYRILITFFCTFIAHASSFAQAKWDGEAGDGRWSTALNWVADAVPGINDDVLLDNSIVPGNYSVTMPASAVTATIQSITIRPSAGVTILLEIPPLNTASPAIAATGSGYGIFIDNGGKLLNSSGGTGASITVIDSIRINNGGAYTHNSRSAHAALVTGLSRMPGTEKGLFIFDVPGGGYTFASTGRTYGSLRFSALSSGGVQSYATNAASPFTVNGDVQIEAGVMLSLDVKAVTTIKGSFRQDGGVFNISAQPNSNLVRIDGDIIQNAGTITETSGSSPVIECNGNAPQQVNVRGSIINNVGFRINNSSGINLASPLTLPHTLELANGVVNTNGNLLTLLSTCSLIADSTQPAVFVNGALRKEGLVGTGSSLFPVGKENTQRWLSLKNVSGNFTVEYFTSNPQQLSSSLGAGINHISSVEYWSVSADNPPTPQADIELSFNNVNSGGVTDLSGLLVAELVSGQWTDQGNAATSGSAGSQGSVVSSVPIPFNASVNYFTLAANNASQNPLPLQFISFTMLRTDGNLSAHWTIAENWHPDAFELDGSEDGSHFNRIGVIMKLPGVQTYTFTDIAADTRNKFYRVKGIASNGAVVYSAIANVTITNETLRSLKVQPSIVACNTELVYETSRSGTAAVQVYDSQGRLRIQTKLTLMKGTNTIPLEVSTLGSGAYILSLQMAGGEKVVTKFIKL